MDQTFRLVTMGISRNAYGFLVRIIVFMLEFGMSSIFGYTRNAGRDTITSLGKLGWASHQLMLMIAGHTFGRDNG
jgi:hypothetical protein